MRKKWIALTIAMVLLISLVQPMAMQAENGASVVAIEGVGAQTRNLAPEAVSVLATGACNNNERAVFAVDGNTKSKWCDATNTTAGKWLMLDLGEVYTINQWVVQNNCMAESNQCPNWNTKNFRLQKSNDGEQWVDVDVVQDNVQTIVDRYVPAFDAQYVRLYITKGAANNHTVRIAEFEVYGVRQGQLPAYPGTNLDPVDYVDPFINTLGDNGQTNPGPRTPFGLAAPGPDGDGGAFSGYYYEDQALKGFSHLRFSGVGCSGAGGNILLMPTTKPFTTNSSVYKDGYDKTSEVASAGYYGVTFNSGIQAELTASDNVGYHRYTFPADGETGSVLIDLSNSYAGMNNATLSVDGNEISGMIESRNVCGHGFYKIYYSVVFDQDVTSYTSWIGGSNGQVAERTGSNSGVWLNFDTSTSKTVQAKVGLSTISTDQAKIEREYEGHGWNFNAQHQATRQLWSDTLSKVEVTDADEENKKIFYTQLYNAMQHPNNVTSSDGKFRAARDEEKIRNTSEYGENFEYYNGWSTWDDFRKYPLYSILEPQRFENMALSMIDVYKTRGSYQQWGAGYWPSPTVRNEFNGAVILDAIAKGLELSDSELRHVMEGMATDTDHFVVEDGNVSGKLEKAYSAYYPMRLAEMLDDETTFNKYRQIAMSYKQLWNGSQVDETGVERGFFTPNGNPVNPQDIKTVNRFAYQGNLWTYRWTAPHDVPGMAELMGGQRGMAEDLQHFFAIDEYVAVNEPDLHVPFLFNYLGMPYLTQYYAREFTTEVVTQKYHNHGLYAYPMISRVYRADPEGYLQSADDDAGALSSWFVFSAMGLFPSNPGDPYYNIGSPIFSEVKLNLDNGKSFTIKANNVSSTNRFIQSATLNGQTFDQAWINHADIMAGGSLVFEMGAEPNYAWGASPEAAPPTYAYEKLVVPAAPTGPVVNNEKKTFGWSYVPGYATPELYEYSTDSGKQWRQVTSNPQLLGTGNYPAGSVQVRLKANSEKKEAAGLPLLSTQDYENWLKELYQLEVETSRTGQLQVKAIGTLTGDYKEDPYVVFQLMDGGKEAWMTNAIPVVNGDFEVSQLFNVNSNRYEVNVYLVESFNGNIYDSLWLAAPVAPQPEKHTEGQAPGNPVLQPLPIPEKPERPIDSFDPGTAAPPSGEPEAPVQPGVPGQPGEQPETEQLKIEFESRSTWSDARNTFNNNPLKTEPNNGGTVVGNTFTGAWLAYKDINFGEKGKNKVSIVYDSPTGRAPADIALEFRIGSVDGPLVGNVALPRTGSGWGQYRTQEAMLDTTITGVQDLYIVMKGSTTSNLLYVGNFDSFTMSHVPVRADYAMLEMESYDEWSTALNPGNNDPLKTENGKSGRQVANTYDGAWLAYKSMNFGQSGVNQVAIEYSGNRGRVASDARVEVRLGGVNGTLLATVFTPPTGNNWSNHATVTADLSQPLTGMHDLYFVFRGTTNNTFWYIGNFDNTRFTKVEVPEVPEVPETPETPEEPPVEQPSEDPVRLEFEKAARSQENNTFNNQPMKVETSGSRTNIGNTFTGAWFMFADTDFGRTNKTRVAISYATRPEVVPTDVKAQIRLGGPDGAVIGEVAMPRTTGWGDYRTVEATLTQPLSGRQTVHVVFTGSTTQSLLYIGNLDFISFAE